MHAAKLQDHDSAAQRRSNMECQRRATREPGTLAPTKREASGGNGAPVFMIKLRGRAGADNIKALRAILKALLRRHQVRCISACEIIKKNPNTIRKRWSRRLTNRGNFVWRLIAYGIRYEIIQQGNHYYCYSDGDYIYD